jgi:hypothetical protein
MDHSYNVLEYHSLILSTEDEYDMEKKEYTTIPKTIKKLMLYLNQELNIYIYYRDHYKNKNDVENFMTEKNLFSKDILVFEPLETEILDQECISELNFIGFSDEFLQMDKLRNIDFRNKSNLDEILMNQTPVCLIGEIYDSSYIKVTSSNLKILQNLKEIL